MWHADEAHFQPVFTTARHETTIIITWFVQSQRGDDAAMSGPSPRWAQARVHCCCRGPTGRSEARALTAQSPGTSSRWRGQANAAAMTYEWLPRIQRRPSLWRWPGAAGPHFRTAAAVPDSLRQTVLTVMLFKCRRPWMLMMSSTGPPGLKSNVAVRVVRNDSWVFSGHQRSRVSRCADCRSRGMQCRGWPPVEPPPLSPPRVRRASNDTRRGGEQ